MSTGLKEAAAHAAGIARRASKGARRTALLVGAAVVALTGSVGPSWSADPTPPAAIVAEYKPAAEETAVAKPKTPLWWAVLAAALAGIAALMGPRQALKTARAAARVTANAAVATAKTAVLVAKDPVGAARTVATAAKGAGRWGFLALGLALFSLTGVALLDIEWMAGLAVGAAGAIATVFAAGRVKAALKPVPVKRTPPPSDTPS